VAELSELKRRFEELAEEVLDGRVDGADAAVVGQLWNYAVRAVAVSLKAKEVEELEARLEELETALERKRGERGAYGPTG
jgi:glutathione S-transferase